MAEEGEVISNKQIVFKDYINGFPKESDMILRDSTIKLKVPEGCNDAVLVKNLYLSCDPYMRSRMSKIDNNYVPIFTPGLVMSGDGVGKVVDSSHPDFKKGDLIAGIVEWEEYSLIKSTHFIRKIHHDHHLPLSYHLGILGN